MNAVVFGGAGFVGSHLADALSDSGHQVRLFDLRPSPYLKPAQEMVVGDMLDYGQVRSAVEGYDVVCNFAGIADLDDAQTKAVETARQNILGTIHLLEAAREAGAKRYMHASSVYVYSNLGGFYRCSKQAAELYIEEYQRHYGLDFTILRFGTLYGERANERNSIFRYLQDALLKRRIECVGTGEELREYINVKDAARLCVHALDAKFRNQHLIITGAYPMRCSALLEMVREILGGKVELCFSSAMVEGHYHTTPYTFEPKIGRKLTSNEYLDLGQGILECLRDINMRYNGKPLDEVNIVE